MEKIETNKAQATPVVLAVRPRLVPPMTGRPVAVAAFDAASCHGRIVGAYGADARTATLFADVARSHSGSPPV